jgi:hypothetical protein
MTAYLLAIALLLCGALWAYRSERSAWNGGICKDNGLPWVRFDTDSLARHRLTQMRTE